MSNRNLLFVIMAVLTISGCASFPNNDLQRVQEFSLLPNGAQKPDVQYAMALTDNSFGSLHNTKQTQAWLKSDFAKALAESGYFANVSTYNVPGEQGVLRIDVELKDTGYAIAMIPAVITGLSLYIIPSYFSDDFVVTATVTTMDGQKRLYSLSDGMKTWQWFPMIFVASSKTGSIVGGDVIHNIWKNLILKMQQDGILTQREADKPIQVNTNAAPTATTPNSTQSQIPATTPSQTDETNRLEKLKSMQERGLITPQDYEKKKKEILDAM